MLLLSNLKADMTEWVASQTEKPNILFLNLDIDAGSIPRYGKGLKYFIYFYPRVNFQCRLSCCDMCACVLCFVKVITRPFGLAPLVAIT